jgi:hypothetical protein
MMSSENSSPIDAPATPAPLPPGYDDYAGEIRVANGKPPAWMAHMPRVVVLLALAYYLYVRAFDPINLIFAVLFVIWLIYTPIAQKRGWFFIPM